MGKKIFDLLERICMIVLIVSLGGMCLFIGMQVFFRFILDKPLSWTEEAARHLMIWSAFLGGAVGYRRNAHLGIDILSHFIHGRTMRAVQLAVDALTIVLASLILYFGYYIVLKTMPQLSSALNIPMGYIYASIPVGFLFIGLFAVERIVLGLRSNAAQDPA